MVVTDLDQSRLDTSADQLEAPLGKLHAFAADVRSADSLAALHQQVRDAVGEIDILVQSSGVTGAQGCSTRSTRPAGRRRLDVDLMGPVRITREFIGDLRNGGWGRIVYLVSEDASQPYDDELPYCAAKAGVLSFAKGLSRSYASEGLLVNTVSPAFIHTPMTDAMMDKRSKELGTSFDEAVTSFLDEQRPYMELKRRGEPRRSRTSSRSSARSSPAS